MTAPNHTPISLANDALPVLQPIPETTAADRYPDFYAPSVEATVEERLSQIVFELNRATRFIRSIKPAQIETLIGGVTDEINGFRVFRQSTAPANQTARFGDIWLQPGDSGAYTPRVFNGVGFVEDLYAVDAILLPILARLQALESEQAEVFQDAIDTLKAELTGEATAAADTFEKVEDLIAALSSTLTAALAFKAPISNPEFTGVPLAPTAAPGTNTAQIATTAFAKTVAESVAAAVSIPLTQKGAANGVASLDSGGKVPAALLPSYVDDVLEVANFAALPGTGETGKVYVTLNTGKAYRWGGSAYVEIVASPGSTDAVPEGTTNKYFTDLRAQAALVSQLAGKQDVLEGANGQFVGFDALGFVAIKNLRSSTSHAALVIAADGGLALDVDLLPEATIRVTTYTAARALTGLSDGEVVTVTSRAAQGDGGHGDFIVESGSATDDDGVVLVTSDGKRLRRLFYYELSVSWFGARRNSSSDAAAGIKKAVACALASGRSEIRFGSGRYVLSSDEILVAMTGVTGLSFVGAGMGVTEIFVNNTSGNGFAVTMPEGNWWLNVSPSTAVNFRDMSIVTNKVNTGKAIFIDGGSAEGRPGAPIYLQNVEVRGHDQFEKCFATGIDLLDATNVNLSNVHVLVGGPGNRVGRGIHLRASSDTTDPVQLVLNTCKITYGDVGIDISTDVEGVYLMHVDCVNNNTGVFWNATAESGLHVLGGHYNNYNYGFRLLGVFDGSITGALLYRNGAESIYAAIAINGGGSFCVTGNQMRGSASGNEFGVSVVNVPDEGTHGVVITGNHFSNLVNGISMNNTSRKVYVGPNSFNNVTNEVPLGVAGSAFIFRRTWAASFVTTLSSGAASETIDVPIPAGQFKNKPVAASCTVSGDFQIIGFYDHDSSSTTATNARFLLRRIDGANIGPGVYRFSIMMSE